MTGLRRQSRLPVRVSRIFSGAYRWRFFFAGVLASRMGHEAPDRIVESGNWKALLACFLYFDTGFTVWVMFGPLAPFIAKQLTLTPTQSGFLVAVPVLAASIVRVTLGNLFQSVHGRQLALLGIALSAIPRCVLLLPIVPDLHAAADARRASRRRWRKLRHRAADGGQQLSAARAGPGAGSRGRRKYRRGAGWLRVPGPRATLRLADARRRRHCRCWRSPRWRCSSGPRIAAPRAAAPQRAFTGFAVSLRRLIALVLLVDGRPVWPWQGRAAAAARARCGRSRWRCCRANISPCSRERDTWVDHARLQHHLWRLRRHVLLCEPAADDAVPAVEGRCGPPHGRPVLHRGDGPPGRRAASPTGSRG